MLLFQLGTLIAACSLYDPASPNKTFLYGAYVGGVWTVLALQLVVFKSVVKATPTDTKIAPLVLDCWPMLSGKTMRAMAAGGDDKSGGDLAMDLRKVHFAASHALDWSELGVDVPRPRQIMHLTCFAMFGAWTFAILTWDTQTLRLGETRTWVESSALFLMVFNLVVRSTFNLKSEQVGVVRSGLIRGLDLKGASAAFRTCPLQITACICITISSALTVWGDLGTTIAYIVCVCVLPLVLSAVYLGRTRKRFDGDTVFARLESAVGAWFEQRALCEGGWWTWSFLLQTAWPPALANGPSPEMATASLVFASLGVVFAFESIATFFWPRRLSICMWRVNAGVPLPPRWQNKRPSRSTPPH